MLAPGVKKAGRPSRVEPQTPPRFPKLPMLFQWSTCQLQGSNDPKVFAIVWQLHHCLRFFKSDGTFSLIMIDTRSIQVGEKSFLFKKNMRSKICGSVPESGCVLVSSCKDHALSMWSPCDQPLSSYLMYLLFRQWQCNPYQGVWCDDIFVTP